MYAIYDTEQECINRRDSINTACIGVIWDNTTNNYANTLPLVNGQWALPILTGYESYFSLEEQQNAKEIIMDTTGARIATGYDDAVELQLSKRRFGQKLVAEVMAETNVEGILNSNPSLGYQLMGMTEQLFKALDAGWLTMAIGIIKQLPAQNLNSIITPELLKTYRNKIHIFLNYPPIVNYND